MNQAQNSLLNAIQAINIPEARFFVALLTQEEQLNRLKQNLRSNYSDGMLNAESFYKK